MAKRWKKLGKSATGKLSKADLIECFEAGVNDPASAEKYDRAMEDGVAVADAFAAGTAVAETKWRANTKAAKGRMVSNLKKRTGFSMASSVQTKWDTGVGNAQYARKCAGKAGKIALNAADKGAEAMAGASGKGAVWYDHMKKGLEGGKGSWK